MAEMKISLTFSELQLILDGLDCLQESLDEDMDDLKDKFRNFAEKYLKKGHCKTVYVLTNYCSTMEENLYRIYTLRDLGYDPYVMIYDKPHAPREIRLLQRWCNNKKIFNAQPDFKKYNPKRGVAGRSSTDEKGNSDGQGTAGDRTVFPGDRPRRTNSDIGDHSG